MNEGRERLTPEPGPAELRDAFALWATGITIITVVDERTAHGLTVSAFTPLSLVPPLVLTALGGDAPVLTYLRDRRRFTVNVLPEDARSIAVGYSDRYPVISPSFRHAADGVLEAALVGLVCAFEAEYRGGDHAIIVGRVERIDTGSLVRPLIRFRREYRKLE